jgi:cystathionine gamma-lyase
VPAGFVRFSCGIEDATDLLADLAAALDGLDPLG